MHEKLCDAEKVIEGLKGIERLHADDELRSSILEVINTSIILEQEPCTLDAREDFMFDVYNILNFLHVLKLMVEI